MPQEKFTPNTSPQTTAPLHMLVVDDNLFNRDILSEYMEEEDHKVISCENAAAAWNYLTLQNGKADIILLDYMMPAMNGMEFFQKLRGDKRFIHTPVIILSASANTYKDTHNTNGNGIVGWLTKPFEREELLEMIGRAISQVVQPDAASGVDEESGEH